MEEKTEALRIFKSFLKILFEFIKTIAFILLVFFILRYFLIQPFIVEGNSMEPGFHNNEYLLTEKVSYRFKEPQRGDVIIFHPPNSSAFYIKRIIGLPGEKLVIEDGKVYIYNTQNPSGVGLRENYLMDSEKTLGNITEVLQEGQYYVLGDNRENSQDSREFGYIPKSNIVGKAFITVFPFADFGLIQRVKYPEVVSILLRPLSLGSQSPVQNKH